MRITTQMLNAASRKAGLPMNNISLLNYINNDGNKNSLLEVLNNKNTTSVAELQNNKNYQKLEKEADELTEAVENLAQMEESQDSQKIYDGIETFFESYNSTMKALGNTSDTMNNFYKQMMTEASSEEKESLESIGITFTKNGTASVDMDKVKAADMETLESLFGSKSGFMSKMKFLSTRIADNAKANVESLSSSYSSSGNYYMTSIGSKYDFWG